MKFIVDTKRTSVEQPSTVRVVTNYRDKARQYRAENRMFLEYLQSQPELVQIIRDTLKN